MNRFFRKRPANPAGESVTEDPMTPGLDAADEATVAGERTVPSVNRARSLQSRITRLLAIALMAAIGLALLTWYYRGVYARAAQRQTAAESPAKARAKGDVPLPPLGRITPPPARTDGTLAKLLGPAPELPDPSAQAAWQQADALTRARSASSAPAKSPRERALDRRLGGEVFARQADTARGGAPSGVRAPSAPVGLSGFPFAAMGASGAGGTRAEESPSLGALLAPTVLPAVDARILPTRELLLGKGTAIDCTLETAIDSTLPGMTTCITATDTFGLDGRIILLERGTKLVGETRGQVQQGAARLFVLWVEARTPTGVVVPLASPGTDALGRAGLSGRVNRHFWDRFGAAILVSIIDGTVQAAARSGREGNAVIVNPSTSSDVMTEVLKGTIAIPPTITKPQGDRIAVLVARDVDFRSVYELRNLSMPERGEGTQ